VPMVVDHARRDVYGDETHLWALLRFAEDGGQAGWSLATRDELFSPHEQLARAGFWLATAASPATPTPSRQPHARPCSLGLEDHGERVD
jgi:hypothetical protein